MVRVFILLILHVIVPAPLSHNPHNAYAKTPVLAVIAQKFREIFFVCDNGAGGVLHLICKLGKHVIQKRVFPFLRPYQQNSSLKNNNLKKINASLIMNQEFWSKTNI